MEVACMFLVCLRNDTVINVMTVSLTEKDVLYSMVAAGSAEYLVPVYQTTRRRIPETVHRITHPLHGGAQTPRFVSCAPSCDHIAVHQVPVLRPIPLYTSGVPRGMVWGGSNPPRNSEEVLDRMSKKNRRLDFLLQFTVFSYGCNLLNKGFF